MATTRTGRGSGGPGAAATTPVRGSVRRSSRVSCWASVSPASSTSRSSTNCCNGTTSTGPPTSGDASSPTGSSTSAARWSCCGGCGGCGATGRAGHGPTRAPSSGGILAGAGGFNTYDGVVQHVILHLHLVNEHVCASPMDPNNSILSCRADIPFEVVWIVVGAAVLVAGIVVARQAFAQRITATPR